MTESIPPASGVGLRRVVTDFHTFLTEIRRIRSHGYATVNEEFERGVVGVSAPVYDFRRSIIAAVNVSAPKTRLGGHLEQAGRVAAKVAAELSAQLGAN
jgi:DNA-binding IclR family transcriptional regulator